MTLQQAVEQCRRQEKDLPTHGILYRVYEDGELIYVGIGGIAKRKPSGRLVEHRAEKHWSSFKHNYMVIDGWLKGIDYYERLQQWDSLEWQFQFIHLDELNIKESELINEQRPIYNTEGLVPINENVFKFIKTTI